MAQIIAILETMWDSRIPVLNVITRRAPRYFKINPDNHSGRRLYKLIGPDHQLLVTNACRELVRSASQHGKPDPEWLKENLAMLAKEHPHRLILVCGKVAQQTFLKAAHELPGGTTAMMIPHPAARMWTAAMIAEIGAQIFTRLQKTAEFKNG